MSTALKPAVLEARLRERGLLFEDLPLSPTTRARLRKGLPIRQQTARKVLSLLRETPVAPDLKELIA